MTNDELQAQIMPLSDDLNHFGYLGDKKPLLAHYTSIQVLESIMKTEQVWFSSPLLMNDRQEMLYGIDLGTKCFETVAEIDLACGTKDRAEILRSAYRRFLTEFYNAHALQVFVLCLSEFNPRQPDGLLSMWRGYGSNGSGAALVFNTNLVHRRDEVPIIVAKVTYASENDRFILLRKKFQQFAEAITAMEVQDDQLWLIAYHIFNYVKVFALTSKHHGFEEENEWRLIYLSERDTQRVLQPRISYFIGPRGPEPKLKLPIGPVASPPDNPAADAPNQQWGFSDILDRIVLGPALSNPLTKIAVQRMLVECGKTHFIHKLHSSTIPFRVM